MKKLNFRKARDDAMASQQYVCLEEYIPTYNNWFQIHVHPSQDDVAVCFLNITEKKEAQQTIGKVNDLYLELINTHNERKATLNRINDGVVSLDKEWRYTFLNDAALDIHTDGRDATSCFSLPIHRSVRRQLRACASTRRIGRLREERDVTSGRYPGGPGRACD